MTSLRTFGVVALGFVAACGGATGVEFFDSPTGSQKDAGVDGTSPTSTSTSTGEPTSTTPEGDASAPPPVEARCAAAKDCADGFVCATTDCRGDGRCVPESTYGASPVCGCDKVTYASASLAKGAVRHDGECTKDEATACSTNGGNGCPAGAKCNIPVGDLIACTGSSSGTCWKLPQNCPSGPRSFRVCGAVTTCTSACDAASTGKAYYKSIACP